MLKIGFTAYQASQRLKVMLRASFFAGKDDCSSAIADTGCCACCNGAVFLEHWWKLKIQRNSFDIQRYLLTASYFGQSFESSLDPGVLVSIK